MAWHQLHTQPMCASEIKEGTGIIGDGWPGGLAERLCRQLFRSRLVLRRKALCGFVTADQSDLACKHVMHAATGARCGICRM